MALAIAHRPKSLKDLYGNESVKKSLHAKFQAKKEDIPHSFMFTGPSGCGKTTVARIVAKHLGCDPNEFYEINSADFRGIDSIRDLIKQSRYRPMNGSVRVWLLDECFAKGTIVKTINDSEMPIEDVEVGEQLVSLAGNDTVTNCFQNKVSLDRVCKVKTNKGETICSTEHKYLTLTGWKFAKDLNIYDLLLPIASDIVQDINSLAIGELNEINSAMSRVRKSTSLLSKQAREVQQKILQSKLFSQEQNKTSRNSSGVTQQNSQQENISGENQLVEEHQERFGDSSTSFRTNVEREPNEFIEKCSQNDANETNKRHSECVCGCARGQRQSDTSANSISDNFELENGICDWLAEIEEFTLVLQSRYSESKLKNSYRGRWEESQIEEEYIARCKENRSFEFIRVESVEVYERGRNDESFSGVVGDTERSQGYVIFYDLEMKNHPSYFANGVAVHNCHKLSNEAQNAMLKMLEDAPDHVYYMLATTDPQKLIQTVRTRCTTYELKPLDENDMMELLVDVVEYEDKTVPKEILSTIINSANGSSRQALQILERIIDLPPKDMAKAAKETEETEAQTIDLCRALLDPKANWKKVASIISNLNADPESVRYAVLGYANSVLLKADNPRAFMIIEAFKDNFYDCGKVGISHASYLVVCGG